MISLEQFLRSLREAELMEVAAWEDLQAIVDREAPPDRVAQWLVRWEVLTRWQAQQLLLGGTKFQIGDYRLLDAIHLGQDSTIYLAQQPGIERRVAIKQQSLSAAEDLSQQQDFWQELKAIASVEHPHIVAPIDAGFDGESGATSESEEDADPDANQSTGQPYFVMEWVGGGRLGQWISQQAPLPIPWACEIGCQIADALACLHAAGWVHRRLVPEHLKIKMEEDGTPSAKLLGFGHACRLGETPPVDLHRPISKLPSGIRSLFSPEDHLGQPDTTGQGDLYSLGGLLLWMLTGQSPAEVLTSRSALRSGSEEERSLPIAEQLARTIRTWRPDLPHDLERILAKSLASRREERWSSALHLKEQLAPFALSASEENLPNEADLPEFDTIATEEVTSFPKRSVPPPMGFSFPEPKSPKKHAP
ncbi:Hypothetical protein PBC10988_25430 [Planctomycetales bacterium 10988]|nr:Hypothetical protein PBC10988_25430 [Planctomycetales bacterium 10988]